jgi:hypothetical protein
MTVDRNQKGGEDMKKLFLAVVFVMTTALLAASLTFAAEYYVVKSRSGILRIVDHKPAGAATIVNGPFETAAEAEKAMRSAADTKAPDASVK